MNGNTRRDFLKLTGAGALASALPTVAACATPPQAPPPQPVASGPPSTPPPSCTSAMDASVAPEPPPTPTNPKQVRMLSVSTAIDGNLLPLLVADFQKTSGIEVVLVRNDEPYPPGREGKADIIVSHYGHHDLEEFVLDGFGEWPRTVFSNQQAMLGPPSDPAKIRGLDDAGEAFKRIAAKKAPFVLNANDGGRYLVELLWNAAGRPDKSGWFFDEGLKGGEAIRFAAAKRGYSMWGLTPFLRSAKEKPIDLEPLVLADPILQRILAATVVKDTKVPGANMTGARALQAYLLSPATQAKIRDVRYPGASRAAWRPAGRHNRASFLPME
jgi:tungstate transport system substrate-binding protein